MNNKKLRLDDALEFILNGADSELESLSEDFDAKDFDVPAVVTDDLENTLFGEVLQPVLQVFCTACYKTKKSFKTHQKKLCLGEKEFSKHR